MELIAKKCPNCGASIDTDPALETTKCLYCNTIVQVERTPADSDTFIIYTAPQKKLSTTAKIVLIVLAIIGSLILAFVLFLIAGYSIQNNAANPNSVFEHRVNSKFIFYDWEITIGDTVEWLKGELSEEDHPNSQTYMVRVPVKLTNKGDETRSFAAFTVEIYGATGMQLSRVLNMHYGDSIYSQGNDIPVGATASNIYIYFPYDGEGDYFISFTMLNVPTREIKISIGQPD